MFSKFSKGQDGKGDGDSRDQRRDHRSSRPSSLLGDTPRAGSNVVFLPQDRLWSVTVDALYGCAICGQIIGSKSDLQLHHVTDDDKTFTKDGVGAVNSCSDVMKSVARNMAQKVIAQHKKMMLMDKLRALILGPVAEGDGTACRDGVHSTTDDLTTGLEAAFQKLPYLSLSDEEEWDKIIDILSVECPPDGTGEESNHDG